MWRGLSVLCTLLVLLILAVPANADTWYRGALLRHSLEPPYRSQLDDSIYARSDCGPAVLGMVLADYGVDEDTLELPIDGEASKGEGDVVWEWNGSQWTQDRTNGSVNLNFTQSTNNCEALGLKQWSGASVRLTR